MVEEVPSQGRFIGVLALVLMVFAIVFAFAVLYAATTVQPVL